MIESWNKLPKVLRESIVAALIVGTFTGVIAGGIYWTILCLMAGNIGLAIAILVLGITVITFLSALMMPAE